jgi:hypothetical protein
MSLFHRLVCSKCNKKLNIFNFCMERIDNNSYLLCMDCAKKYKKYRLSYFDEQKNGK